MQKSRLFRLFSLLLALMMAVSLAACESRTGSKGEDDDVDTDGEEWTFGDGLEEPDEPIEELLENNRLRAAELEEINYDTIGWLQVPGTTIDNVVLFYPHDENEFYSRRNFYGGYSYTGVYYADFRSKFDGGRQGLSQNTVIYGHSMEDDPEGPLFSQLKKFLDEDFAKEHPYIGFSTLEEDMVWEVFAVFHCYVSNDRSNNFMVYNTPDFDTTQGFSDMIAEAQRRSYLDYDVQVSAEDKILTLSTCCYNLTPVYPNDYRYVVMARLVDAGASLDSTASLSVNPSPKEA